MTGLDHAEPITKPPRAGQVLAALADRHQPGQVVTLAAMTEVTGLSQRSAARVRTWARSVDRWPYAGGWSQSRTHEEVLAAVSARYQSGQAVSLTAIVEAAAVSRAVAIAVRRWARASGRWPYADGRAGRA